MQRPYSRTERGDVLPRRLRPGPGRLRARDLGAVHPQRVGTLLEEADVAGDLGGEVQRLAVAPGDVLEDAVAEPRTVQ